MSPSSDPAYLTGAALPASQRTCAVCLRTGQFVEVCFDFQRGQWLCKSDYDYRKPLAAKSP